MRYGTFPVLFFGGITAAGLSLEQGLPPLLVYLAVVGTASVILLVLEARYPRQDDWRALGKDYRIDCGFLA